MNIVNLTQHPASKEQLSAGVIDLSEEYLSAAKRMLTFDRAPSAVELRQRAVFLARFAKDSGCKAAMIGGAPYLMAPLEWALEARGITPMYSFSQRVSAEKVVDGEVVKTSQFRHLGFVGGGKA